MAEITIQLTKQQEHFLKLFAKNHYPEADDNLCTDRPIHIVQTERERVVDTDYSTADAIIYYVAGSAEDYDSPEELIRAFYEDRECPIEIVSFDEAYSMDEFIDIYGDEQAILDEKRLSGSIRNRRRLLQQNKR